MRPGIANSLFIDIQADRPSKMVSQERSDDSARTPDVQAIQGMGGRLKIIKNTYDLPEFPRPAFYIL
jgi:hypothetical protein